RLLGIDAGLRSGWQAMMGGYAASRMVGAGGKMAAEAGGKTLKAGGKVGGGAFAGGTGMTRALKNNSHVKPMPSHRHAESPRQEGQFSTNMMNGDASRYENNGGSTVGKGKPTQEARPSSNKPMQRQGQSASISSDHSGGVTPSSIHSGQSQEPSGRVNIPTSPKMTNQPSVGASDGHIHPKPKHTLFGGNRTVQRASHFLTRAHNTGYDAGQKMNHVCESIKNKKDMPKPKDMEKGLRDHDIR